MIKIKTFLFENLSFLNFLYTQYFLCFIIIVCLVAKRNRSMFGSLINIALILISGCALNLIIKMLIKYPLPEIIPYGLTEEKWDIVRSHNYSFPSGHMAYGTLLFSSLYFEVIKKYTTERFNKFLTGLVVFVLSISAIKIIAYGFHFPIDVFTALIIWFSYVFLIEKSKILERKKTYYAFIIFTITATIIAFNLNNNLLEMKMLYIVGPIAIFRDLIFSIFNKKY